MNGAGQGTTLIAQLSRWQHLGDGFRGSRSRVEWAEAWPFVLIAAAVVVAVAVYAAYRRHYDFSRRTNEPARLFRELCVMHQLNRAHRTLLWRLQEELELNQPAQVFLTPSAFEASQLPPTLRRHAEAYGVLRERLF